MKNKSKIMLSSIMTIVLCACLIAGSTFALFTADAEKSITITSGNVAISASITAADLYSVGVPVDGDNNLVQDENGSFYSYHKQTNGTFANGGTAAFDNDGNLTLTRVTPGDKVVLTFTGTNIGNVIVKARYSVTVESGEELAEALVITIKDAQGNVVDTLQGLDEFVSSSWETLAVGSNLANTTVEILLPVDADNDYQHNNILANNPNYEGVSIAILVEAVQGNANVQ